jgi:hypothetical protein
MRIRRTFPILLAVVIVAAALILAVQLRKNAPPEAARLLPGADAFFYVNLGWARKAAGGNALPSVPHDPEYERFIQATGIEFERDLDAAAFAVHYPASWPGGGTGGPSPEPRFSEVFVGKFHGERLAAYLKQISKSVKNYNSVEIFTISVQNRNFRVAILGPDSIAASNHDDPAVIRGIVDRSRRLASPFGGPSFLRKYYKRVQLASPVWIVARIDPSSPEFSGWRDFLHHPADIVVSASYHPLFIPLRSGALHLRAEALAGSPEDARNLGERLSVFLSLFHGAESSVGSRGNDPDVKAFFDSLQVRQEGDRAILSATMPLGFLHKIFNPEELPPAPAPFSGQPSGSKPH